LRLAPASSAGDRVVRFLLPDRAALGERLQPRGLALGLRDGGLRPRDLGLDGVVLRLQRFGVDLEQRLARADRSALGVQALLEDPGHARADLDVLRAGRLAHVLPGHRKVAGGHLGDRDLGGRKPVRPGVLAFATAGEDERKRGGDQKTQLRTQLRGRAKGSN
jgi:hypothetical protein